jgi:LAO/AO transport system kinase
MTASSSTVLRRALAGDRVALARALSWIENEATDAEPVLDRAFERTGRAFRIGVTGPPGAGKSTLVTRLAQEFRKRGLTVAVVAVDPTSPFSGGALLGDRVRMSELAGDSGVFIRSMATRGSLGGVAVHTEQVCDLFDAAGFERIVIETVGVGQSELEIAQTADVTIVVLVPESGDGVQAMKAGLMEIGDLFVINKADREGAERGAFAVRSALELRAAREWTPPVLLTVATRGEGVQELLTEIEGWFERLRSHGQLERRRRERLGQRLQDLLKGRLWADFAERVPEAARRKMVEGLAERRITPHQATERLIAASRNGGGRARK